MHVFTMIEMTASTYNHVYCRERHRLSHGKMHVGMASGIMLVPTPTIVCLIVYNELRGGTTASTFYAYFFTLCKHETTVHTYGIANKLGCTLLLFQVFLNLRDTRRAVHSGYVGLNPLPICVDFFHLYLFRR